MLGSIFCDKCGDLMTVNSIHREACSESTEHYCPKCGYRYELGLRYSTLLKQNVKYVRFNL